MLVVTRLGVSGFLLSLCSIEMLSFLMVEASFLPKDTGRGESVLKPDSKANPLSYVTMCSKCFDTQQATSFKIFCYWEADAEKQDETRGGIPSIPRRIKYGSKHDQYVPYGGYRRVQFRKFIELKIAKLGSKV